jgi:hypothetical protein
MRRTATLSFICFGALVDALLTISIAVPLGLEANPIAELLVTALGFLGYVGFRVLAALAAAVVFFDNRYDTALGVLIVAHMAIVTYWAIFVGSILL